ncbi:MAG: undecaprenyl/decaprenyl-phosphate alpha-N-acetylglucosaminyl 1-phosphate transferase [Candidatus Sumerlaeaceae bacterium]|nr:undecaprenyl/decaprenyl-phosphate alpha-N-acetylglucosaminyl 1-phosphate transferase [Candidatus Sumerlaeaceae bacterium]
MSVPLDLVYVAIAGLAFGLGLVCVPLAQRFGQRFGFVDAVNPAKIHDEPKVRCGGVGIFAAFMGAFAICLLAAGLLKDSPLVPESLRAHLGNISFVKDKLGGLMLGATILFLTGLADDRFNLRPTVKLFLQILSALPLVLSGITVKFFVPGMLAGAVMTIAWVVLLTNAFNFLDNMDGLSSGVAIVAALNFFLISRGGDEYFMMAIIALFIGAVAGFWRYNFPRARLFMGDSGSLFIGYMLAGISTLVTYYKAGVPTQAPVIAPLIVLGVPIFDTVSVLLIRWKNGAPLMKGDQNHFSHRLVALGFSRVRTVLFIYLVTFAVGITAVNLRYLGWAGASLALVQVILFFVIIHQIERAAQQKQLMALAALSREREHGETD